MINKSVRFQRGQTSSLSLNHCIGTQVQIFLDENGDQAIAYLAVYEVAADGSVFEEVGAYDGASA